MGVIIIVHINVVKNSLAFAIDVSVLPISELLQNEQTVFSFN